MLKCEVTNEKTKIEVNSNVVDLTFEITMLIRSVIGTLMEKNKVAGDALLEFCKTVLPNIIDPDMDEDEMSKALDVEIKREKQEAIKKAFADDPNSIFDLLASLLLDDDEDGDE